MKTISRTLLAPLFTSLLLATASVHAEEKPREVTVAKIEEFLKSAGLQACRVEKLNPAVSSWHGTIFSAWVEMAPDCTKSNADNPDVGHFHQFNNKADRDAMISRYRSSLPRGINLHAGIWPVGDFGAIALIGPNMNKYRQQIQDEFKRRLDAEKTGGK